VDGAELRSSPATACASKVELLHAGQLLGARHERVLDGPALACDGMLGIRLTIPQSFLLRADEVTE
jgi:hypothetical protein